MRKSLVGARADNSSDSSWRENILAGDCAGPAVKSESGNEWIVMLSGNNYTLVYLTLQFE